jgi:O-antigen ligase
MFEFHKQMNKSGCLAGWREYVTGFIEKTPFHSLLFMIAIIYLEGVPGLRWLVWTARLFLLSGLVIWFYNLRRKRCSSVHIPFLFLLFFVYSMLSGIWSTSVPDPSVLLDLMILGVFFFMATNVIQPEIHFQKVLWLVQFITLCFTVVTIVKTFGTGFLRAGAFPGQDPNVYGFYLLLAMGIQLAFIAAGPRQRHFWLHAGLLILNLTSLLITESRGDFLGFVVMFLMLFWVGSFRKRWLVFAGFVLALLFFLPPGSALWERFTSLAVDRGNRRLDIWLISWHIIQSHPWFGIGLSNFPNEIGTYIQGTKTMNLIHPGTGVHNSILGIWSELGLVGLLFFGWILATVLMHGRQVMKRLSNGTFERLAIQGLLIATTGIFAASLCLGAYFRKYFWLPMALIEVLYQRRQQFGQTSEKTGVER